ncbi:MAG: ABC transporter permease [Hyphomicrobiaceae bacterium]|nr:ABC transporter permease [Hyphomicrobiaceae bacterium]
MNLVLDIALTHILGRLRQTLVSVVGVALGVGFTVAMSALMVGSQNDFVTQLIDAIPHVNLTDEQRDAKPQPAAAAFAAVEIHGLRPSEDRRGLRNPAEVIAIVRGIVPGGRVAASLIGQGVARYGGTDIAMSLTGIDPRAELQVTKIGEDIREGSLEALAGAQDAIVIGDAAARKLGARLGDTISVSTSKGLLKRFKIVGLFHSGVTASDEGAAFVLLKSAQILFDRANAVNQVKIKVPDIDQARAVATRIEREIGTKATSWEEAHESLLSSFQIRNVIMYTVVGAILLVAGFGIYNIVSTIVHEKARDIAILKSLGFAEGDMRAIFVIEGVIIGVLGALAGSALGFALTELLGLVKFEIKGGAVEITRLPLYRSWVHYAIAGGFAIVSAAVAGYLPARKAAKVKPVDIIRGAT